MSSLVNVQSLPIGSIDAYIQRAFAVPMLTAEEERELATRWHENQDIDAAKQLVMAHVRFVIKIAKGYSGYGLNVADLIQEGNIGLMKAVKRFDPNHGVRLVSFAVHWIKSEIHDFIIRNWRIVKVATTKAQRKLFFNLRGMKKRLGWFTDEEIQGVAHELGVPASDVREMESRLNAYDASYDPNPEEASDAGEQALVAPAYYLEDKSMGPAELLETSRWKQNAVSMLRTGLDQLKPREKYIIEQRWLIEKKITLQELAEELKISAERIRQIEKSAIDKLKKLVAQPHE